jgi:hypothetical protein
VRIAFRWPFSSRAFVLNEVDRLRVDRPAGGTRTLPVIAGGFLSKSLFRILRDENPITHFEAASVAMRLAGPDIVQLGAKTRADPFRHSPPRFLSVIPVC